MADKNTINDIGQQNNSEMLGILSSMLNSLNIMNGNMMNIHKTNSSIMSMFSKQQVDENKLSSKIANKIDSTLVRNNKILSGNIEKSLMKATDKLSSQFKSLNNMFGGDIKPIDQSSSNIDDNNSFMSQDDVVQEIMDINDNTIEISDSLNKVLGQLTGVGAATTTMATATTVMTKKEEKAIQERNKLEKARDKTARTQLTADKLNKGKEELRYKGLSSILKNIVVDGATKAENTIMSAIAFTTAFGATLAGRLKDEEDEKKKKEIENPIAQEATRNNVIAPNDDGEMVNYGTGEELEPKTVAIDKESLADAMARGVIFDDDGVVLYDPADHVTPEKPTNDKQESKPKETKIKEEKPVQKVQETKPAEIAPIPQDKKVTQKPDQTPKAVKDTKKTLELGDNKYNDFKKIKEAMDRGVIFDDEWNVVYDPDEDAPKAPKVTKTPKASKVIPTVHVKDTKPAPKKEEPIEAKEPIKTEVVQPSFDASKFGITTSAQLGQALLSADTTKKGPVNNRNKGEALAEFIRMRNKENNFKPGDKGYIDPNNNSVSISNFDRVNGEYEYNPKITNNVTGEVLYKKELKKKRKKSKKNDDPFAASMDLAMSANEQALSNKSNEVSNPKVVNNAQELDKKGLSGESINKDASKLEGDRNVVVVNNNNNNQTTVNNGVGDGSKAPMTGVITASATRKSSPHNV